ncbi:MAG: LacI family DNA-binding transcriptional regulator [Candidatus Sulfotelmatobacter sp.]
MKFPIKKSNGKSNSAVTLKSVAERVGLTASTVSAVLNNSSAARSVPEQTKKRVLNAARGLHYRPNFLARSLRANRTYTIGVILEEIGDAYGPLLKRPITMAWGGERRIPILATILFWARCGFPHNQLGSATLVKTFGPRACLAALVAGEAKAEYAKRVLSSTSSRRVKVPLALK